MANQASELRLIYRKCNPRRGNIYIYITGQVISITGQASWRMEITLEIVINNSMANNGGKQGHQ
jgi:hypothetical protein